MAKSNKEQAAPAVEKVEFEQWHAARENAIPAHHHKEILKADFMGQGLKGSASMADFDKALKRYGVTLG